MGGQKQASKYTQETDLPLERLLLYMVCTEPEKLCHLNAYVNPAVLCYEAKRKS